MNLNEFCKKYKYTLATTLPDNWDRYNNGIPSVTTILSLLQDKGLEYVALHNSSAIKSSIEQGIQAHKDAELFYKPKSGTTECNLNVIKFHTYYGVNIIGTEVNYIKDISGNVDLVCTIDGKHYNVDYKYSKYNSPKYYLQLMGYKYLNGYDGMLVYLKGKLKIIEVDDIYYDVFIELKDYFLTLLEGKSKS